MSAEIAKLLHFPDIGISQVVNHYNPGRRTQDLNSWGVGVGYYTRYRISVDHMSRRTMNFTGFKLQCTIVKSIQLKS